MRRFPSFENFVQDTRYAIRGLVQAPGFSVVAILVQQFVHAVALVSDASIVAAQQQLWDRLRIVPEPAGAAPLAALISGAVVPRSGERIGLVISGGNTPAVSFGSL